MGTYNLLGLASRVVARLLLSSSFDVYGDPEVHPQPERYLGTVKLLVSVNVMTMASVSLKLYASINSASLVLRFA